jgi:hypothetical protein
MNFNLDFQIVFVSQRWAALKEVFAALAAAIGKATLDYRITHHAWGVPSTLFAHSMASIANVDRNSMSTNIIETSL